MERLTFRARLWRAMHAARRELRSPPPPSVGVVVPVRNGAATVAAAIRSVLAQQPLVDDVVVVVAASDDDTLARIPVDPRVRVVHQRSTGLGAARNEGVAALATDLVGFCDADDRWLDGALAVRIEHLVASPSRGAVAGRVRTTANTGEIPVHRIAGLGGLSDGYTPGAVLVRRELVAEFDEMLRIATDAKWIARLLDSPRRLDLIDAVVLEKGVGPATLSTDLERYRREMLLVVGDLVRRRRSD